MNEAEVLRKVIADLEELKIPYALTGGLAVSFYGRPRSTHDFDIIVQIPSGPSYIKKLLAAFGKEFYISEEGIIDAVLHQTMFNIIHHETGLKIDMWILKDSEYDREAFGRRKKMAALGTGISILAAEDMILNKLQWYKVSEIDKHLNDVRGVCEIQKGSLDKEYLKKWAARLLLQGLLNDIL
ncbi:MAG: hypothetical protein ABIE84_01310 [bacterium]